MSVWVEDWRCVDYLTERIIYDDSRGDMGEASNVLPKHDVSAGRPLVAGDATLARIYLPLSSAVINVPDYEWLEARTHIFPGRISICFQRSQTEGSENSTKRLAKSIRVVLAKILGYGIPFSHYRTYPANIWYIRP